MNRPEARSCTGSRRPDALGVRERSKTGAISGSAAPSGDTTRRPPSWGATPKTNAECRFPRRAPGERLTPSWYSGDGYRILRCRGDAALQLRAKLARIDPNDSRRTRPEVRKKSPAPAARKNRLAFIGSSSQGIAPAEPVEPSEIVVR